MIAINCYNCYPWVILLRNINTLIAVVILSSAMKPKKGIYGRLDGMQKKDLG